MREGEGDLQHFRSLALRIEDREAALEALGEEAEAEDEDEDGEMSFPPPPPPS